MYFFHTMPLHHAISSVHDILSFLFCLEKPVILWLECPTFIWSILLAPLSFHNTLFRLWLKHFLRSCVANGFYVCLHHGERYFSCPNLPSQFQCQASCLATKRHIINLLNTIIFMQLPKRRQHFLYKSFRKMSRGMEAGKQILTDYVYLTAWVLAVKSGLFWLQDKNSTWISSEIGNLFASKTTPWKWIWFQKQ